MMITTHTRINRALLILILLAFVLAWPGKLFAQDDHLEPPAEVPPAAEFGAIESFWAPDEAAELGVGWERILFYWNEIQPKAADDWNTLHVLEEWLTEAKEQDRAVVGLLKNTPAWATDGDPFSGVPRGLYLPIEDPDNLWANYVRRIVQYYGPRGVHNWIVWNEPEIDAGVYGHEFDGTVEEYARLLQVAYLVAKEHDPQAMIHLAGYSYWHDPDYLRQFFKVITADPEAAENEYYFDVLTLHIYFRVETVADLVTQTEALQDEFGLDKPIWINETNAAPNQDPWWPVNRPVFQVNLDQQAWYIVQAHALGFGSGAERIGVYKLIDILLPEGGESFGILRPDYSKRPAYIAFRTTIDRLGGFQEPVNILRRNDYFIVTFQRGDELIRVLWARNDRSVTLSIPGRSGTAVLYDYLGNAQDIEAVEGSYRMTLEGALCQESCDIGGPPVFLVERGANHQTPPKSANTIQVASVTPQPELTPSYTPWPTETPSPTTTPTATSSATPTQTSSPTAVASPTNSPILTTEPSFTPTQTGEPFPTTSPVPKEIDSVQFSDDSNMPGLLLPAFVMVLGIVLLLFLWFRRSR